MKLLSPMEWAAYQGVFIGLWTDEAYAYALYEPGELVAVGLQGGTYPALPYAGADWFQRLAKDLNGHVATGFHATGPAIEQFRAPDGRAAWPDFTGPEGEGIHQVAVGPVYGELTEPAHFRFFASGERIFKLQARLGYAHRGILGLMRGQTFEGGGRYAARICGDSTVAHTIAFARAVEAALDAEVPVRACFLRGVMAEIERLSNHCGDLGEIAALMGNLLLADRCALMREYLANAAQMAFGHRLMMDVVSPGGVRKDITQEAIGWLCEVLDNIEAEMPDLRRAFLDAENLQERMVGIGVISPDLAGAYNAGGYVGRAAGQSRDARVSPGYLPYVGHNIVCKVAPCSDVASRVAVWLADMAASINQINDFLKVLPEGPLAVTLAGERVGMGLGVAEGFRGSIWCWLKIEGERIQDIFVVDTSVTYWPLLAHAAIASNLIDFPLIERSINPSPAGSDG